MVGAIMVSYLAEVCIIWKEERKRGRFQDLEKYIKVDGVLYGGYYHDPPSGRINWESAVLSEE